eukprot:COSAG02_NODE_1920_length_10374_cov_9.792409_1_plen_1317_part_10
MSLALCAGEFGEFGIWKFRTSFYAQESWRHRGRTPHLLSGTRFVRDHRVEDAGEGQRDRGRDTTTRMVASPPFGMMKTVGAVLAGFGCTLDVVEAQGGPANPCSQDGVSLVDEGDVFLGALENSQDCTWSLSCSDTALSPMLTFSAFHTEGGWDFLYLYDNDSVGGDPTVTLHGVSLPDAFVAAGSVAVANYVSDSSVNGDGFTATFSCAANPCSEDGASLVDEGDVFLGALENSQDCTWSLSCSDTTLSPMLTFSAFHTEGDWDFLYLYDNDSVGGDPTVTLHGVSLPDAFVAAGSVAVANYVSDSSVNGDGFTATFSCAANPCSEDGASLVDEGDVFLGALSNDQDCSWLMTCSNPSHFPVLTFGAFGIESGWDFLYLYDDSSTSGSAAMTLHGSLGDEAAPASGIPITVSTGPVMTARYTSDGSVTGEGFSATFVCEDSVPEVCTNDDLMLDWPGGFHSSGHAVFGAQHVFAEEITEVQVVIADPLDGCMGCWGGNPSPNPTGNFVDGTMDGKIVLIRRGSCQFTCKTMNAQDAGAVAVVIYNDHRPGLVTMGGPEVGVTIPAIFITGTDGDALNAAITAYPGLLVSLHCSPDSLHSPNPCGPGGTTMFDSSDLVLGGLGNNRLCQWSFFCTHAEEVVVVTFSSFDIESNRDFVYMFESADATGENVTTYTGSSTPAPWLSTSQTASIVYESNDYVNGNGFIGLFFCAVPRNLPPPCVTVDQHNLHDVHVPFVMHRGGAMDLHGHSSVVLDGHADVDDCGLSVDGDRDRARITHFDYAEDGSWSVGFWITKEECTSGPWEYIYSHMASIESILDPHNPNINTYMRCDGDDSFLRIHRASLRTVVMDNIGQAILLDFNVDQAVDIDEFTTSWMMFAMAVGPSSLSLTINGQIRDFPEVELWNFGSLTNIAVLSLQFFSAEYAGSTMYSDIFIGSRADGHPTRHFMGKIAGVSISSHQLCAEGLHRWYVQDVADDLPCQLSCGFGAVLSSTSLDGCEQCDPGTFAGLGHTACHPCSAGQFDHDNSSATPCVPCVPGRYTTREGDVGTCSSACAPGQISPAGSYNSSTCVDCGPGRFRDNEFSGRAETIGDDICDPCPPGRYSDQVAAMSCDSICPAGAYGPAGSTAMLTEGQMIPCSGFVTVNIHLSSWGNEVSWYFDEDEVTQYSTEHNGNSFSHRVHLSCDTDHTFTFSDSWGDGWHGGYWELISDNDVLIGGGQADGLVHGSGGTFSFRGEELAAPTCTQCPPGTSDHDSDSTTPCLTCPAGRYTDVAGDFVPTPNCTNCTGCADPASAPPPPPELNACSGTGIELVDAGHMR